MKGRWILAIIAVNLVALVGLAFAYPHLMVSPGAVIPAHAALASNCFACHAPLRGASSERCTTCHALPDIGLRTTKGVPMPEPMRKPLFHQQLLVQDCMACHSDHEAPRLARQSRKPFSHALLRTDVRGRCESCHTPPKTDIHRDLTASCSQCHKPEAWKPAGFDHSLLSAAQLNRCESCHNPPADTMHGQVQGSCAQCHTPQGWKPAHFEHDKLFLLAGEHNANCVTCHTQNDYSRYTCYGCHEHTPANVRAKHEEEGIRNVENCAQCHRSANGEGGERQERGSSRRREKGD